MFLDLLRSGAISCLLLLQLLVLPLQELNALLLHLVFLLVVRDLSLNGLDLLCGRKTSHFMIKYYCGNISKKDHAMMVLEMWVS